MGHAASKCPSAERGRRRRAWLATLCLLAAHLGLAAGSDAATITVNGVGDTVAVDFQVTLREAITSLNNGADVNADVVAVGVYGTDDRIHFAIPAGGVHTIQPSSPLPDIEVPMTIDGYTQAGASVNTESLSDNAVLLIELDGSNVVGFGGLVVVATGSSTTIRGLIINRFSGGIVLDGAGTCSIVGNFIGTDASGTIDLGNFPGVAVDGGGANTIGGADEADRNLISGNGFGVFVSNSTDINLIQGNFIGIDASGNAALGNQAGIVVSSSFIGDRIGGVVAGEGNVISGNFGQGVVLAGTTSVRVEGNIIGADPSGVAPLPNGFEGILITNTGATPASHNRIGSANPLGANVIAFNLGNGINVTSEGNIDNVGNTFQINSIFDNALLGIDLGGDGVTPNDPGTGDGDTGQNNLQNFPVLTSVVSSGGTTAISGTLDSTPNFLFLVRFFSSPQCDPSGFGEGRTFVGVDTVPTDGSGMASFDLTFPVTVPLGHAVTAIARPSDPTTDTSEFSACVVEGASGLDIPGLSGPGLALLCALLAAAALALLASAKVW